MTSIIQLRVGEIAVGTWGCTYTCTQTVDVIAHELNQCRRKKDKWKHRSRNVLDPQSRFNLVNRVDAIGAVSVGDGGILLTGIVAEQQHLLALESVFRPSDIRQWTDGVGTLRMVGVLMVDEVDWCSLHQRPGPWREEAGMCTYSGHPYRRGHR